MHRIDSQGRPYNELGPAGLPLYNIPLDTSAYQFNPASIRLRSADELRPGEGASGLVATAILDVVPHDADIVTLEGVFCSLYLEGVDDPVAADTLGTVTPNGLVEVDFPAPAAGTTTFCQLRVEAVYSNVVDPGGEVHTRNRYAGAADVSPRTRIDVSAEGVLTVEIVPDA